MHEVAVWFSGWSATLYSWSRTAVGIVLWFWVVSGVVFGLRFLAFVLLDKNSGSSSLVASTIVPFPMDGFHGNSRTDSPQE
jgi:hypothetical protein